MRYLECSGTACEIGRQQGEAYRQEIQMCWAESVEPTLAALIQGSSEIAARINVIQQESQEYLQETAPLILDEIQGIGEGASLSSNQAFMLSMYNSLSVMSPQRGDKSHLDLIEASTPLANGCSALAFSDSPAGPILMKTYDPFGSPKINMVEKRRQKAELENRQLYVLKAHYKDGPAVIGMRLAGSVWTESGVNTCGVAFASASLHPRLYPQRARALPQHMLGTLVINRYMSTAEARAELPNIPTFGKGYAMTIGDKTGDCIGVEKSGIYTGINDAETGLAFQTNHVRSPRLVEEGKKQDQEFWTSSYHTNSSNRVRNIRRRLPGWMEATDLDELADDLFHAGNEGDLIQDCTEQCQYWITTWAALLFPQSGEFWLSEGLPEEKQWQKWKL